MSKEHSSGKGRKSNSESCSLLRAAVGAFELMTILPVGKLFGLNQHESSPQSTAFFPFVGLVLGLIQVLIAYFGLIVFTDWSIVSRIELITPTGVVSEYTPLSYMAFILLAAIICLSDMILTRLMHLDGLADTIDARFGSYDLNMRKQILKDPHIGVFGVCAVIIYCILFTVLVALLISADAYVALIAVYGLSRGSAMRAAWSIPPIFDYGIGSSLAHRPQGAGLVIGWLTFVVAVVLWLIFTQMSITAGPLSIFAGLNTLCNGKSFLGFLALILSLGGIPLVLSKGFGGMSGDIHGASIVLSEIVILALSVFMVFC